MHSNTVTVLIVNRTRNAIMRNITVSVDEETYRQARLVSVLRDTSVSALVREFLTGLTVDAEKQDDWGAVWEKVDAWGVEVGERPARSRTYDGRA